MIGPAKIGYVGSQNLTTFLLLQYGMATQFSEIVHNLTGFPKHFTEPKCYISALRYISSNHMVYFSSHALFSQAWSQLLNASLAQLQNYSKLCISKHYKTNSKHYCNTMYVVFMHGWLVQVELYGAWLLKVRSTASTCSSSSFHTLCKNHYNLHMNFQREKCKVSISL